MPEWVKKDTAVASYNHQKYIYKKQGDNCKKVKGTVLGPSYVVCFDTREWQV